LTNQYLLGQQLMVAANMEFINKRYVLLEKLGAGGMGAVFRASDRLTGQTVALKRVLTPLESLENTPASESSDLRLALSREFRLLAALRHPNIVSVIDYGFADDEQPYFTMSLLENARTLLDAAQAANPSERIGMLVQVLQALTYLHRRGILHRDLKPGNVLVDASGSVKVLDFGLSVASSHSITNMQPGMAGTLAYMAPELFIEEEPSVVSDLYAFGVITYELFAGHPPFYSKNIALMINSILSGSPDWSVVDDRLEPVLKRLLDKNPAERYASAADVLGALCEAAEYPRPRETSAIRESFLQTAPLVGRSDEFQRLMTGLKQTIEGHGSVWLIGGESGIGKSRLMDELRIRALVRDMLVLRGQSVSEGSTTYHVWRDPLRLMVLNAFPDDDEAAVLKAIIPDIGALLDRDVADAPELHDSKQVQTRLFRAIEALLRRQSQPILLILEDLQWAGSESLALLNHLANLAVAMPLQIIGDYRDDERPDLPQSLNNPPVIKLSRLSKNDIAELSVAMLGTAGKRREILDLLQRETEGNAFFLVEVVRALAEEAGQLEDIGRMTLPHKVFAGGIRSVVERRLTRVPETGRLLLKMAAVIGRRIDLDVLKTLAPDMDIDAWLTTCANAAVLDIQDEKWHFAHSKLRECLLDDMPEAERQPLYCRVAEAIEITRPDHPDYVPTLAHLWHVIGDDEKELIYVQKAGFQAFASNAGNEAAAYFTRALELIRSLIPEGAERAQQELAVQVPLSLVLMQTRGFTTPEVENAWLRSETLCNQLGNPPVTVGVLFGLCGVYTVSGRHELGIEMDKQILALAPTTPYPNATRMQAYYTATNTHLALGMIKEAMESARKVLEYYDPAEAQYAIAMYGGNPGITAKIWIAYLLQVTGYPNQALEQFNLAMAEARALGHPFTLSTCLTFGWFHQIRRDSKSAFEQSQENSALAAQYGFDFNQLVGMPVMGWAIAQQGKHAEGIAIIEQAVNMMASAGAVFLRIYYLGLLADAYLENNQVAEASRTLKQALENIENGSGRFYEPEIYRLSAETLLRQGGDSVQAEDYFLKAIEVAHQREMRLLELRAASGLARLHKSQGKTETASQPLESIYNSFTEGFDTLDLQDARALLNDPA
jgi:tetratricopeptide (TPR) repeat protein